MPIPVPPRALRAPPRLVTATRGDLRHAALAHLDAAVAAGHDRVSIDLGGVVDADIGGIGILVLLQKRAHDRGIATCLVNPPDAVLRLLALTQLDALFLIDTR